VLRDPAAIGKRFAQLEAGAEHSILVFTKPPYAVEPGENLAGLQLLARGVEARSVYERSVHDDPAVADAVRAFIAAGEQARIVDQLPLKLVLIDERIALFTMEDPVAGSTDLTTMIVEHPGVRLPAEARVRAHLDARRPIRMTQTNRDPRAIRRGRASSLFCAG